MTKRPWWRALIPGAVRHALSERVQALIAGRTDPLEARLIASQESLASAATKLQTLGDRLSALEAQLAAGAERSDHAERVELPSLTARMRTLEQKVNHLETVETRLLHRKSSELRRELELLSDDARRTFEYWEVRTDNIYASLASHLPELGRREDEL